MRTLIDDAKRRLLEILCAFLVGAAVGFGFAQRVGHDPPSTVRADTDALAPLASAHTRSQARPSASMTYAGLRQGGVRATDAKIDLSVPLSKQYDGLVAAADRGDLGAACKLVQSFEYCANGSRIGDMIESVLDTVATEPKGSEQQRDDYAAIEAYQLRAEKIEWYCSDLQVSGDAEWTRRLHQAAELGDLGAMVRFSLNPPLGQISIANAEAAYLFKKEAPRMLQGAALRGDFAAMRAVFSSQRTGVLYTDFGSVPVARDPELMVATANVLREFADQQTRNEVEEYLAEAPSDVVNLSSSSRVLQIQRRIREAVMRSDSRFSPEGVSHSLPPPVCE